MALAVPASALADGRSVLGDYEDNGQIDGCYTLADYDEALALVGPGDAQYGAIVDVIEQARVTNVERPGAPCADPPPTNTAPVTAAVDGDDDSDSSLPGSPLAFGALAIVVVAGVAAAVWARARRSGRPS